MKNVNQPFDFNEYEKLISQHKWQEASQHVKSTLGTDVANARLNDVTDCIKYIRSDFLNGVEEQIIFLVESFRILRNFSTTKANQHFLLVNTNLLDEIKKIFEKLNGQNNHMLLTKVILQFLVNLIVSNPETSSKVAQSLYDDIFTCFRLKKNNYEIIALLYNIHLQNRDIPFRESLFKDILGLIQENNGEYALFLAELFLHDDSFWKNYEELGTSNRIISLELFKKLCQNFCKSDNIIFQTVTTNTDFLEPYEVSLLLDILGCLCGDEIYLRKLQKDKELLIRSGVVLINIHRLGKESENYFSSVQKLSELKEPNEAIQNHPAFGFKVGLVRLIGNLCWKNKKMQDLVREAEIIPVLLDCCNIDARNPLIMQWVIFAVRNLCENNSENQAFIAGLHKEGTVTSALVEEMGLTLQDDECGKIRIVPLDFKN
ncbi:hypothetical protein HHI36_003471 [Cryptolaemus montrouzieri]|uniref:Ataxin-10 n=1 Tax=Cryptolaemus montrouzieri TaxID=559131 RepID=A0ABD2PDZ6_9CUCU